MAVSPLDASPTIANSGSVPHTAATISRIYALSSMTTTRIVILAPIQFQPSRSQYYPPLDSNPFPIPRQPQKQKTVNYAIHANLLSLNSPNSQASPGAVPEQFADS